MENPNHNRPLSSDWAIFKITDALIRNPLLQRNYSNLETLLTAEGVTLKVEDLIEVIDKIEQEPELFETQDWSSKDGRAIALRFTPKASEILIRYGGYLKYIQRRRLSENEILDIFF